MATKRTLNTLLEPELHSITYERYGRAITADEFQGFNQMTSEKLPVIKAYRELFSASHAAVVQTDQTILLRLFSCVTPPGFVDNNGSVIAPNLTVQMVEIPLYFEMLNAAGEQLVQPMKMPDFYENAAEFNSRNPLYYKRTRRDTIRSGIPTIPFSYIVRGQEITPEHFSSGTASRGLAQTYMLIAALYATPLEAQRGSIVIDNNNAVYIQLEECRIMYNLFTDRNQGARGPIPNEQYHYGQGVPIIRIPLGFIFLDQQRRIMAVIGTQAQT